MSIERNHSGSRAAMGLAALALLATGLALPPKAGAQELEEIVVTARRQEEKLKEVPLAITAFDAKDIEAAGISNLKDVAALTPGLSFFNAFGENLPVPIIRGIVPQDIFGSNAAAIFVDGVYVAGREGLNFSQLDIERIEVLKGPQSAMYGRNAFSGAINYVTKPPSDVFEAKTEIQAGNRGKQEIIGSISGPIFFDSLTGRVSALYDDWDGSYDNTLANTDIGGYRYRSFQGRLRWAPADTFEANMGVYYSKDSIDDPATAGIPVNCEDRVEQTLNNQLQRPFVRYQNWCGVLPDLAQMPDMLDPASFGTGTYTTLPGSVTRDSMPKDARAVGESRELTRGNINLKWEPGYGTIDTLTGYSDTQGSSVSDFERSSGNTLPFLYCTDLGTSPASGLPTCNPTSNFPQLRTPMGFIDREHGSDTKEWSQEIRFTSPQDESFRYTVGGYYFHSNARRYPGGLIHTQPMPGPTSTIGIPEDQVNDIGALGVGPFAYPTSLAIGSYIFGPSLMDDGAMDPLNRITGQSKIKSWSIFAGSDFDFAEKWTLHGEIRLTQEAQDEFSYSYKRCAQPLGFENPDHPDQIASKYKTNTYPFNQPPVDDCGDDFYDLRVGGAEIGPSGPYTLAPCVPNVDEQGQDRNDGTCTPGADTGSARFEMLTGRIGLKYQMNSDWMAYTSIAWGQKPGGIQLLRPSVYTETNAIVPEPLAHTYTPEKITAYELGIKGFTADRRVGMDLSVFYNDWTSIVLRQLTEISPLSGRTYTSLTGLNVNSGDAGVWGWETTFDLAMTENLTGRLTAAFTDSTIKNARQDTFSLFPSYYTSDPSCAPAAIAALPDPTPFIPPTDPNDPQSGHPNTEGNEAQIDKARSCQSQSGVVSGNTQMRQPEWTASASLTYNHQLAGEWKWFARADANYVGKIFIGNDNEGWMAPYYNVNFRAGVNSPRYSLEFWVRNMLDNEKPIAAFRDIYWTNDDDLQATRANPGQPAATNPGSNFDDFPPLRMSITYPSLRTYGIDAKIRFGGAVK